YDRGTAASPVQTGVSQGSPRSPTAAHADAAEDQEDLHPGGRSRLARPDPTPDACRHLRVLSVGHDPSAVDARDVGVRRDELRTGALGAVGRALYVARPAPCAYLEEAGRHLLDR